MSEERWKIRLKPPARRALEEDLPEAIAAAAREMITGDMAAEPYRVGKPLDDPYEGLYSARRGTYRVLYRIDVGKHAVDIHSIRHRRDAYHS